MTVRTTAEVHRTIHTTTVEASADRVFAVIADVVSWPHVFPPTVHAEVVERTGDSELIRLWATANGTARTWTSRRRHDVSSRTVTFRQERSQPPVLGMGGEWRVEPLSPTGCRVHLTHDFSAVDDDPDAVRWLNDAVDTNSEAELAALKAHAELGGDDGLITFDDSVVVAGSGRDVYEFLAEAQHWTERLPHVQRVALAEPSDGLQVLEMDTRAPDGSTHTTCSIRVCETPSSIRYKQHVLPALMTLHTGRWFVDETADGVAVTSRHTLRINADRVADVLGANADIDDAVAFVRRALSTNSTTTLNAAKAYAEARADARVDTPS